MKKILKFAFLDLALLLSVIEIFIEGEWVDKADDILFAVIALAAILLPKMFKKKLPKFFPFVLLFFALAVKVVAVLIENDDAKAVGADYVILVFLTIGIILSLIHDKKNQKSSAAS